MMIGFVGLGRMGGGMARQLLAKGHDVVAYDPDRRALALLVASRGRPAGSPKEVADQAEIIFASLPTLEISDEVALGSEGIIGGSRARIYVETSTIGPVEAKRLAATLLRERGIHFIDAPVSGGPKGADEGTLTTIVAGDEAAYQEAEPYIRAMANHIVYAGAEVGLGQIYKLINNYIVMSAMATTCEAIAVGVRAGADEALLLDVINHSTGKNFATSFYFPTVIQPRAKISSLQMAAKDVRLFVELGESLGHLSTAGDAVLRSWEPAAREGRSMVDWYRELLGEADGASDDQGVASTQA